MVRRGWTWLRSEAGLRVTTVASIAANVLIVITGGAVRLTASGLGCPTWPRCTDDSLVRTRRDRRARPDRVHEPDADVRPVRRGGGHPRRRHRATAPDLAGRVGAGRHPGPGRPRRHQRPHAPQPVGGVGPPAAVDGHPVRHRRVVVAGPPRPAARRIRRAARSPARPGGVAGPAGGRIHRVDAGGRDDRHRQRPARRVGQRGRPAASTATGWRRPRRPSCTPTWSWCSSG